MMLRWLLLLITLAGLPRAAQAQPAAPVELSVASDGIAGRFYDARNSQGAVVLMLGGSDGGYPSRRAAEELSSSGYSTLALAYFSGYSGPVAGVPDRLEGIPLSYFERALAWLRKRHPGRAVVLIGESRGAELALLLASRDRQIGGVIAFSPSSLVWGAVGDASGQRAAWRDRRGQVSFATSTGQPGPAAFNGALVDRDQLRRAGIPVERIAGPILLVSSRTDNIWPAAYMADRIVERRNCYGARGEVVNLQYDNASHLLMGPGRGLVRFEQGTVRVWFGGTEEGTLAAREDAWGAAKDFLAARSGRPAKAS